MVGVRFAALPATVEFSGLVPGSAGLYQLNITIPGGAEPGIQPVAISINGVSANTVLLPIQ
jgi:uncharacterized protein (TIGR03437 family)